MLNEEKSASGGEEQNKDSDPEVKEIIPPTPVPDKPKLSKIKILILGACGVLVLASFAAAYFLGRNSSDEQVACTQEAKICPDGSSVGRTGPKCEFAPCPTGGDQTGNPNLDPGEPKATSAGMKIFTSAKLKDISFSGYSLDYPDDWTVTEERNTAVGTARLELAKDGYSIVIYQAPMGGGGCIYEGDIPEGPYSDKRGKPYVDVEAEFGSIRRTQDDTKSGSAYSFCQKNKEDGSYGSFTSIGSVSYIAPANPDKNILMVMDEILKSVKTL